MLIKKTQIFTDELMLLKALFIKRTLNLNKITDFSGFGYRVVFSNYVTKVLVTSLQTNKQKKGQNKNIKYKSFYQFSTIDDFKVGMFLICH